MFQIAADSAPKVAGSYTGPYHVHTLAFDSKTHDVWAVMVDEGPAKTGYIQRFSVSR